MNGDNRDYRNLSGSEIVWGKQLNEFRILTHIKNTPITKGWNKVSYNEWSRYPSNYRKDIPQLNNYISSINTIKDEIAEFNKIINDPNSDENQISEALSNRASKEANLRTKLEQFEAFKKTTEWEVWKDTGRIRGNSHYKEDRWKIQIPSITFMQKNELEWNGNEGNPPIVINYIPEDYVCTSINNEILPNVYNMG